MYNTTKQADPDYKALLAAARRRTQPNLFREAMYRYKVREELRRPPISSDDITCMRNRVMMFPL